MSTKYPKKHAQKIIKTSIKQDKTTTTTKVIFNNYNDNDNVISGKNNAYRTSSSSNISIAGNLENYNLIPSSGSNNLISNQINC